MKLSFAKQFLCASPHRIAGHARGLPASQQSDGHGHVPTYLRRPTAPPPAAAWASDVFLHSWTSPAHSDVDAWRTSPPCHAHVSLRPLYVSPRRPHHGRKSLGHPCPVVTKSCYKKGSSKTAVIRTGTCDWFAYGVHPANITCWLAA